MVLVIVFKPCLGLKPLLGFLHLKNVHKEPVALRTEMLRILGGTDLFSLR